MAEAQSRNLSSSRAHKTHATCRKLSILVAAGSRNLSASRTHRTHATSRRISHIGRSRQKHNHATFRLLGLIELTQPLGELVILVEAEPCNLSTSRAHKTHATFCLVGLKLRTENNSKELIKVFVVFFPFLLLSSVIRILTILFFGCVEYL